MCGLSASELNEKLNGSNSLRYFLNPDLGNGRVKEWGATFGVPITCPLKK
jgi:hypothetical protein